MNRIVSIILLAGLFLTGCAKFKDPRIFTWGDYELGFFKYYQAPENKKKLKDSLGLFLENAEKTNKKIAPGLYAEYGNLQSSLGEYEGAIESYLKEKKLFPESTHLMDSLIAGIKNKTNREENK